MFNEVIFLKTEQGKTFDNDGFEIPSEPIKTKCFASVKSTSYKEYFEALRSDEQATDIFIVDERDYNLALTRDESGKKIKPYAIEYDGTEYRIVRRYKRATKANYTMELTCKEVE